MKKKFKEPLPLSRAQKELLYKVMHEVQNCNVRDGVPFAGLFYIAKEYCNEVGESTETVKEGYKDLLFDFKARHYPSGLKPNKLDISWRKEEVLNEPQCPRFVLGESKPYRAIEKKAYMAAIKLCKKYIYSKMDNDAACALIEGLEAIRVMINKPV